MLLFSFSVFLTEISLPLYGFPFICGPILSILIPLIFAWSIVMFATPKCILAILASSFLFFSSIFLASSSSFFFSISFTIEISPLAINLFLKLFESLPS